ncbi:MAG: class I SAM-dependent methyltransferase [Verrucomicrobia bacterium]|nr:class I SAM-dependent methyltransferase [Verrucomicrobiota bacterium]
MKKTTAAALAPLILLGLPITDAFAQEAPAARDEVATATDTDTDTVENDEDIPPALTTYKGREIAQTMHWLGAEWLLRQEREREEATTVLMRELQLKPGMVVCDMGSGNGYHSLKMAEAVGDTGKVYAVDIQPEMLRLLKARARAAELTNIETIENKLHDPMLPENTFDLILLVDVYHEFSHPEQMLQGMLKGLKKDGILALVEFRLEDPDVPIKLLHKMSKEQILKEYLPNGYKLVREFDELPWQHLMFFGRADSTENETKPVTEQVDPKSSPKPELQEPLPSTSGQQ